MKKMRKIQDWIKRTREESRIISSNFVKQIVTQSVSSCVFCNAPLLLTLNQRTFVTVQFACPNETKIAQFAPKLLNLV
jgi:hypothetical protein